MDKIAVLIPCYNEEKTIYKVVTDFKAVLPDSTIYVYDNNSSDKTSELTEKAGAVVRKEYKQGKYLFMATRKGIVKKTPLLDYANVRKTGLAAISLREDDELIEVKLTNNKKDIFLVTKYGQCIRFPETDVRSMGRTAMGVIGMQLNDGDEVIGMQLNTQGDHLLIVSANGMGKLTSIDEFKSQNRGGKGGKCY